MITLYTGTPGSGKSLHAAATIRRRLKAGKPVLANFRVVCDENWKGSFTYLANNELLAGNFIAFANDYWHGRRPIEDEILLIIDEAQLLFNSRNWQDEGRMQMLEFMSQHRKYGYSIVLVCQSDIMIDKQFRTLVEYEAYHRKVKNIGLGGKLLSLLALGNLHYCIVSLYSAKLRTDGYFFRYKKSLGRMYDTYATFEQQKESGGGVAVAAPSPLPSAPIVYNAVI